MKNVVGAPAVGENFFYRANEINKVIERIDNGNNLQIAASRRVGKTSILQFLRDNNTGGHLYVYVDTESVENEQEFYKKLLKALLKTGPVVNSKKLHALLDAAHAHEFNIQDDVCIVKTYSPEVFTITIDLAFTKKDALHNVEYI